MDLVFIIGAQAVGKMTVGEELAKITNTRLLHNHVSLELALTLFEYGTPGFNRLNKVIREIAMEEFAKQNTEGMIFTYVCDFDAPSEWEYLESVRDIFKDHNVYFVELISSLETRMARNISENRLAKKPSKRNLERTKAELPSSMKRHRLVSNEGEITFENYLRINNEDLEPGVVAKMIKEYFKVI